MSDFELLKNLQAELIRTLEERKSHEVITRNTSKAKINRLRLQLNEVMLRIERACTFTFCKYDHEDWE